MMERKIKKINGINLEYSYDNKGERCIVFIHGVGGDLTQFESQMRYFNNYSTLAVSLRGHGKSDLPINANESDMTICTLAKDLIGLINYLGIKEFHFVGNSAGGIIGYELVKMNINSMLSLTTFGTAPKLDVLPLVAGLIVKIDKFMIKNFSAKYFNFLAKNITNKNEVMEQTIEMFNKAKEAIPLFRSNISNYDYTEVIKQLRLPYFITKGSDDKEINKEIDKVRSVLSQNKFVKVYEIKNAGHLANLDQPKTFNRELGEFFDSVR